jgi:hypothetical protein
MTTLEKLKLEVWRIGATFLEDKDGVKVVSLGRLSFLAVFAIALWKWAHDTNPPDTMMTVMYALLGYITASKLPFMSSNK